MAISFHEAVYATHPLATIGKRSAALAKTSCAPTVIPEPAAEHVGATTSTRAVAAVARELG